MKKAFLLFATLGCSISWVPTYATTITINLGPPGRVTGEKIVSFSGLNDLQLNGQTLSLDLVFSGNGFVRLFKSTSPTFLLLPMLDVFGAGTINDPTGSGYLFDETGFPLLADETGRPAEDVPFPLDIYGAHLDITLPNGPAFDVTGGELGLFPNASQRWNNQFQIGDVPDSGCTLFLALTAVVLLFSLDAAMRRCPSSQRLLRPRRSSVVS